MEAPQVYRCVSQSSLLTLLHTGHLCVISLDPCEQQEQLWRLLSVALSFDSLGVFVGSTQTEIQSLYAGPALLLRSLLLSSFEHLGAIAPEN